MPLKQNEVKIFSWLLVSSEYFQLAFMRIAQRLLMSDRNSSQTRICLTLQVFVLGKLGWKPFGADLILHQRIVNLWQKKRPAKGKAGSRLFLTTIAFSAPTRILSSSTAGGATVWLTVHEDRPSNEGQLRLVLRLASVKRDRLPAGNAGGKKESEWDIRASVVSFFYTKKAVYFKQNTWFLKLNFYCHFELIAYLLFFIFPSLNSILGSNCEAGQL